MRGRPARTEMRCFPFHGSPAWVYTPSMGTHMSTAKTRTISLLALCAALVALSGCGGGSMHSPTEVYVLIASNVKLPYWQTASEGFKRAAAELGVRYDIVGPETYDPKAQHEEFRRVLNRQVKPSGILISAAAPELVRPDIDAAIAHICAVAEEIGVTFV